MNNGRKSYVKMAACAVWISVSFMLADCFAQTATPRFERAEPVWAKGQATEMNSSVRFNAAFEAEAGAKPILRITGTSAYRIRLNGRYVGYGPARSPKGFFRVDEWPLGAAMREGRNELEIEAVGYNCNSFCFQDQPAFLQAEVVADGKVLVATAADGGGFSVESTERIRKVPRYSFQRTFAEAYRYGNETKKLPLERRPDVRYLERIASYPKFELNDSLRVVSRAKATYDPNVQAKGVFFIDTDGNNPKFKAFAKSELESNPWDEAQKIKFSGRVPYSATPDAPISLRGGDSVRIDAGLNDCGFFGMKVKVAKPGRILFTFDEVLTDGEVSPTRMTCCNCVEWRFERPGAYEVETFEPYVWRYADLTAIDGDFEVSELHVRAYKNPDAGRAAFRCSDPALEKIFEAARETFVQNAVDVFTDCPSRERAGWLCDSFFIGRVNKLLTGDTKLERLFLQNYAIADEFEYIPKGAIPMCYPADDLRGRFIPNWAMWLVIEAEEYLKRSGDRATVAALKPRLVAFVEYMKTFRNSDGLLEKLPSWVFVEWSQANKLVQDVNYPSNMTWAEVLDVMNRLYDMPELAAEAERVRETVRRQSWTGEWFCDNAVRQKDGTLKLSGECTETCQYYAFFFRTATPKTYPRLWKTLVDDFGPKRLEEDRKTLKSHPAIWPSNAFIGNYLRLECLAREGLVGNILDETKGFFLYMAERTGTLWEMISPTASCDHGFASHAAVYLFRDILGVKSVDLKTRKVVVEPPKDIGLDWCEGTLPISPGETVTIRWRRDENPTVEWNVARGAMLLECDGSVTGKAEGCRFEASDAFAAAAEDETRKVLKTSTGGGYVCEKIGSLPVACSEVRTVEGREPSFLPDGKKFKLVWHDEFDGTVLDESKWSYRTNFWGRRAHWFAAPEDGCVEVADGRLRLKVKKLPDGQFVSPQLQTGQLMWDIPHVPNPSGFWPLPKREKPKFVHRYGYYECRCRLQKMPGWWSAFWMQSEGIGTTLDPAASGIEHDIMESFDPGEVIVSAFHMNGYGPDYKGFHIPAAYDEGPKFEGKLNLALDTENFHTFGMLWEPDGYSVYVDGRFRGRNNAAVSHVPEFVLLTTEVKWYRNNRMTGKPVPELDAAVIADDDFVVDYVRVYDIER